MSNRLPKVSVVIPTYNYGRFIERAISSVLSQSYQDYEIIVVDDASTDDTKKNINQLIDKRIKYFRHDLNRGPSAARNTGIQYSQGKFIAFLDSDDEWLPDKLHHQVNLLSNSAPDVGLVYCGVQSINSITSKITNIYPKFRGNIFEPLLDANIISGCDSSLIIRREIFNELGLFDENMESSEDWDMWLRISQFYKIDYVDMVLVKLWSHGKNISADMNRTINGREALLKKNKKLYDLYPGINATQYYRLGILCYKNNFMVRGRKFFLAAFYLADTIVIKFKCLLQYLISITGFNIYIHLRTKFIDNGTKQSES
jgi:glycosyltransferase involved in cell wall biosynthesis